MAAPPPIKQIRVEDVVKADGTLDVERLVEQLNQFMGPVANALAGGLTFADNFRSQDVVNFPFRTKPAVEDTFPIRLKLKAGLRNPRVASKRLRNVDTDAPVSTAYDVQYSVTNDGHLKIEHISNLDANTAYHLSLTLVD